MSQDTTEITCPTCNGSKVIRTQANTTNEDSLVRYTREDLCDTCGGTGKVPA